jgi:hypothetical protein
MRRSFGSLSIVLIVASLFVVPSVASATPSSAPALPTPSAPRANGHYVFTDSTDLRSALNAAVGASPQSQVCVVGASTPQQFGGSGVGSTIFGQLTLLCNFGATNVEFFVEIDYSPTGSGNTWTYQDGTYRQEYGSPRNPPPNSYSFGNTTWKCIGDNSWYYRSDGVVYTDQLGYSPQAVSHTPLHAYC